MLKQPDKTTRKKEEKNGFDIEIESKIKKN